MNALKDDADFLRVQGDLENLIAIMESHEELRGVLTNPFLNAGKKSGIVRDVLDKMSCAGKTIRLVGLLVEHGRIELLKEITASVPEAWNERQGRLTFEVSSALAMTDSQKKRLNAELERLEGKTVNLVYRIDPDILGGLTLRRGHVIYDISVEGDLLKLKDKIQEGQQ